MTLALTTEQIANIIKGSIAKSDDGSIAEDEAERIIEWCEEAAVTTAMLQLVVDGNVAMRWHPDDPEPTFFSLKPYRAPAH